MLCWQAGHVNHTFTIWKLEGFLAELPLQPAPEDVAGAGMNCPHRLGNAQALLAREDQALLVRAAQALLAREDQALLVREDQALLLIREDQALLATKIWRCLFAAACLRRPLAA